METKQPIKDRKDLLKFLDENRDIEFINFLCADILGDIRGFTIPAKPRKNLENAMKSGKGIDGSSLEGLVRIEESDLILKPDPTTFRIWPWKYNYNGNSYRVGVLFGDILNPDGTPNSGDTRNVLKNALKEAHQEGFEKFYVGPEYEFFLFEKQDSKLKPAALDKGSYFSMGGMDPHFEIRMNIQRALNEMGIETGNPIETNYDHHEVAPNQHEIDLEHLPALEMADGVMLHKYLVKEVARKEGLYATFMPKPIFGENGNGMHVHQSLTKKVEGEEKNAFFASDPKHHHLSETALQYTAGLMQHIDEITPVLCQWVNSFKRLVPGYEAPIYKSIGTRNRSTLIRIPEYEPGKEGATRIELRCPDPACNPYLAFGLMLKAGLEGIKNKYQANHFVGQESMYDLTGKQLKERDIQTLPKNLKQALKAFQESKLAREALGGHLHTKFIENKEAELNNYHKNYGRGFLGALPGVKQFLKRWYKKRVSPFEYKHHLPRL